MGIKNILLVGCGEIGSRHLQALAKMEIPVRIWAIDPSSISLKTAKVRFEEIPINENIQSIKFESEIPENLGNIDLCIISTTSKIRFFVFKEIIDKVSCKNFIFEKVLFQKEEHFIEISKIIEDKKIKCWVNNFRREEKYWKNVKKYFKNRGNFKLYYGKSDWRLCTNAIHIMDLIEWLSNEKIIEVDGSLLDEKIYESKRSGFIELTGKITGKTSNKGTFEMHAIKDIPDIEVEFEISNQDTRLFVNEAKGEAILMRKENEWKSEKYRFQICFQSDRTQNISKSIIEIGNCNLPTFNESINTHRQFLKTIIKHLNKISNLEYDSCPIT
tara:strand:- start:141 stop:1127 length:987 start_codon:yes stop_codon:yes gene_type:complete